jgi:hypothetical protein
MNKKCQTSMYNNIEFEMCYYPPHFKMGNLLATVNLVKTTIYVVCILFNFYRAHFRDLCEHRVDRGNITMMKDLSLMKKGATGEFLYNKLQDIAFDDVLSKYILHEKVGVHGLCRWIK